MRQRDFRAPAAGNAVRRALPAVSTEARAGAGAAAFRTLNEPVALLGRGQLLIPGATRAFAHRQSGAPLHRPLKQFQAPAETAASSVDPRSRAAGRCRPPSP